MELINATRMAAAFTTAMEPSGRELLVVVIKGTFDLPATGGAVALADAQVPLVTADSFTGAPGRSAPWHECDFAPRKPRCDILALGSAHAPKGRPTTRVVVGLGIGSWSKQLAVVGSREWTFGVAGCRASSAHAFVTQPITYDVAFGGTDARHEDPAKHSTFLSNPVGLGYHTCVEAKYMAGAPLPRTEEVGQTVERPDTGYKPMSFGPVGRGWPPRSSLAGTYDAGWLEEHFPFLPPDFHESYYQCAPVDQQLPFPLEGQQVTLTNLTPDGARTFALPSYEAPIVIYPKRGGRENHLGRLDTIVFEPDLARFTITWRVARPLRRDVFELAQTVVGRHSPRLPGVFVAAPASFEPVAAREPLPAK
jgi:hypothetical protein